MLAVKNDFQIENMALLMWITISTLVLFCYLYHKYLISIDIQLSAYLNVCILKVDF